MVYQSEERIYFQSGLLVQKQNTSADLMMSYEHKNAYKI